MSNQKTTENAPSGGELSTTDQIMDLLLDALVERQRARRAQSGASSSAQAPASEETSPASEVPANGIAAPSVRAPVSTEPSPTSQPPRAREGEKRIVPPGEQPRPITAHRSRSKQVVTKPPPKPKLGEEGWEPPPRQPNINMAKTIGRLIVLVVVMLVLVNVPVNKYGVSLARILPDSAALVIREGLVVKGDGPEIYILQGDKLRWISSLDAFEHMGLNWGDVRTVEDAFLEKFEKGQPLHVLLKCRTSPHIYRLENQEKRWIQDIETFDAEGHVWNDVRFVSCVYLRDLPDGAPIPEDAGIAPQP